MKIGILGGGQLGRMFIQNALNYPVEIHVLDPSPIAPCKDLANEFTQGDFNDYQTVLDFGQKVDCISIEIEHINVAALKELEKQGKRVVPSSAVLEMIQDKGLQKTFYQDNNIPTSPFVLVEDSSEIAQHSSLFPAFQKLRKGGYDGKGVQKITKDTTNFLNGPSILEQAADLDKEISIIAVSNGRGEVKLFPIVEMVINQEYNLLDYLFCPADLSESLSKKAEKIVHQLVQSFDSAGIFAVELFINKDKTIWVNEVAPRAHNSGHSTIEAAYSSQFDQLLRCILDLPLGSTKVKGLSAMVNLIGEENHHGKVKYQGLEEVLAIKKTYLHLYGKNITQAGRKMGHITILGESKAEILPKIEKIKRTLKVISQS